VPAFKVSGGAKRIQKRPTKALPRTEERKRREMRLSEALAAARLELAENTGCSCAGYQVLADLVDAVEETLLARQKEADVILGLAELRRWGGSE